MQLYELGKLIGSGSFGQVFLCRNKQQEKSSFNYVVKKLRMMQVDQKQRQNIENQLKLLQKLRHPNIVSYKDSFTDKEGNLCIVMIYCESGDMDTKIRAIKEKGKNFTQAQILDWLVQTALAIHYLHNQRILHRDLKTQNLFLKKDERVRLGDFGISKMLDSTQDLACTTIGTPYYMAPQLFRYKPYSYKSDIWSFGVILYQICNLRRPFDAQSYASLAVKIMKGSYPSITPTYSKQLRDLINSMLSMKPQKRPTIIEILNKGFIRKRLQKYVNDVLSRNGGSQEMDDIYLDTLREQAQLLNVNLIEQQTLKKYPSSKDLEKRWTRNIFSKRSEQQQYQSNRNIQGKRKSTFERDSNSLQKNLKKKEDSSSSSKGLNLGYDLKDQKQAFVDHKKKKMMEKVNQQRNIHDNVMKLKQEQYDTLRKFKMEEDYSMDEEIEQIYQHQFDEEVIAEESQQDHQETTNTFNEDDEEVPEKYNSSYYKILGQLKDLRHNCQTSIGANKYLRAIKGVSNGFNKKDMIEILGPQMIGYWHLIDQIMYYQNLLKTLPKE